jgi:hypothetical protein
MSKLYGKHEFSFYTRGALPQHGAFLTSKHTQTKFKTAILALAGNTHAQDAKTGAINARSEGQVAA